MQNNTWLRLLAHVTGLVNRRLLRLIARKFDDSKRRSYPGRSMVYRRAHRPMAQENATWGYDGLAGALANLGHHVSNHREYAQASRRRAGSETKPKHYLE
jgi:hypothetical protein